MSTPLLSSELTSLRKLIMIEEESRTRANFNPDNRTLPPFLTFLCIDMGSLYALPSLPPFLNQLKLVPRTDKDGSGNDMRTLFFVRSLILYLVTLFENANLFKRIETLMLSYFYTCYDAEMCRLFNFMAHGVKRLKVRLFICLFVC
jgi:hypothetical protein